MSLATKEFLPPGAATLAGTGPTIAGFRLESVPTLPANAEALAAQAPGNRCIMPGCSGRLGVYKGVIKVADAGGLAKLEDSYRCKKQSYVACELCRTPVPATHPRQLELDQQWQALE